MKVLATIFYSITLVSYERSETPLSIKVFPTLSKRRAWEVPRGMISVA